MIFILQPFGDRTSSPNFKIDGKIARYNNRLHLNYSLIGELEPLEIPERVDRPTRKHELWQTTCFEFFLGLANAPTYWEFNLSPTGHWNVYQFEAYRQGMEEEAAFSTLPFTVEKQTNCLNVSLEMSLDEIVVTEQRLDAAIAAVIKHQRGEMSYWALTHRASEADFHLRESFTLEI